MFTQKSKQQQQRKTKKKKRKGQSYIVASEGSKKMGLTAATNVLSVSSFRRLNEILYTKSGAEAFQLLSRDSRAYGMYHDGYREQVRKWPVDPLDVIIGDIKEMFVRYVFVEIN